jgi:hypothetical protein
MTQYALLIYGDESQGPSPEEMTPADMEPWQRLGEEMGQAGVIRGGSQLEPSAQAQSLRLRNGEVLTTAGPFAETSEQLGGFYLVECGSIGEALEWAAKIPAASNGTIEVRPIVPPWDES